MNSFPGMLRRHPNHSARLSRAYVVDLVFALPFGDQHDLVPRLTADCRVRLVLKGP